MTLDLLAMAIDRFSLFWLIVARVSGLFFLVPIFGNRFIPSQVRIGFIMITAMILLPAIALPSVDIPGDTVGYVGALARELAFGLALGFLVSLLFAVAEVAGQILDVEMGYSLVNVIDPVFGHPLPLMGNFLHIVMLLVFLVVDGHHLVLSALMDTFARVPPGAGGITDGSTFLHVDEIAWMFWTAVRIASPVLGVLFLSTVVMGLIARATPQMNVFVVGLPIKLAVGMLGLLVIMPAYVVAVRALFPHTFEQMALLVQAVAP